MRNGIEPAPERSKRTTWLTFLRAHWTALNLTYGMRRSASIRSWGNNTRIVGEFRRAKGVGRLLLSIIEEVRFCALLFCSSLCSLTCPLRLRRTGMKRLSQYRSFPRGITATPFITHRCRHPADKRYRLSRLNRCQPRPCLHSSRRIGIALTRKPTIPRSLAVLEDGSRWCRGRFLHRLRNKACSRLCHGFGAAMVLRRNPPSYRYTRGRMHAKPVQSARDWRGRVIMEN